ncbi:putative mitochondrial protein [Andalucia godoyi]|uniref:Putative mitochondrial protein n=1 Tax=Andalucia godoyi TaxID=505711 RepID=A0A8K0AHG2_ANDGO|nr:putative mitochondrial protein [Andalucia godoyi]|eukprot:ANDGO_00834.mRNA.1 putative mitochondrial protein
MTTYNVTPRAYTPKIIRPSTSLPYAGVSNLHMFSWAQGEVTSLRSMLVRTPSSGASQSAIRMASAGKSAVLASTAQSTSGLSALSPRTSDDDRNSGPRNSSLAFFFESRGYRSHVIQSVMSRLVAYFSVYYSRITPRDFVQLRAAMLHCLESENVFALSRLKMVQTAKEEWARFFSLETNSITVTQFVQQYLLVFALQNAIRKDSSTVAFVLETVLESFRTGAAKDIVPRKKVVQIGGPRTAAACTSSDPALPPPTAETLASASLAESPAAEPDEVAGGPTSDARFDDQWSDGSFEEIMDMDLENTDDVLSRSADEKGRKSPALTNASPFRTAPLKFPASALELPSGGSDTRTGPLIPKLRIPTMPPTFKSMSPRTATLEATGTPKERLGSESNPPPRSEVREIVQNTALLASLIAKSLIKKPAANLQAGENTTSRSQVGLQTIADRAVRAMTPRMRTGRI